MLLNPAERSQGIWLPRFVYFCTASGGTNVKVMTTQDGKTFIGPVTSSGTPESGKLAVTPSFVTKGGNSWMLSNNTNQFGSGHQMLFLDLWSVAVPGLVSTHVTHIDFSSVIGSGASAAVWSGQWFVDDDGSVHVFAGASPDQSWEPGAPTGGNGFVVYETHPTDTVGFTTWSAPVAITGTSLPSNLIDPFVIKIAGTYYMFVKDETTKFVIVLSSSSLLTGWTVLHSGDFAGWGTHLEAPFVFQIGSTYRILLDAEGAGIYSSDATDPTSTTWSAKAAVTTPSTLQHGMLVPTPTGFINA